MLQLPTTVLVLELLFCFSENKLDESVKYVWEGFRLLVLPLETYVPYNVSALIVVKCTAWCLFGTNEYCLNALGG